MFKHPKTGKPDLMQMLGAIAVIAASFKFVLEGVVIAGINFGHVDATVYAAFLSPVLGVHGIREYMNKGLKKKKETQNEK